MCIIILTLIYIYIYIYICIYICIYNKLKHVVYNLQLHSTLFESPVQVLNHIG